MSKTINFALWEILVCLVENNNGCIYIVFDLTVCGKCLRKGLLALKHFQRAALDKGIQYFALIGVKSERENARIIELYREGLLSFPCKAVNVKELYEKFSPGKDNLIDTPFYVFADENKRSIDFFKPIQYEVKELIQWLELLVT